MKIDKKMFFINHKKTLIDFGKHAAENRESKGNYELANIAAKEYIRSVVKSVDSKKDADRVWRKLK